MIRPFTLFCKLRQISFSDRQWFEMETGSFLSCDHACSTCGARGQMRKFAHYDRYLVELKDNQPAVHSLTIPRYRCNSCGHTHALLSSSLIPYRSYSLRFILHVLHCYFLRELTIGQLCSRYGISAATLYSWKALLLRQKGLWLGVLEDLRQESHTFLYDIDGRLLEGFHGSFLFSFLERMPCTDSEVRLPACKSPPAIT